MYKILTHKTQQIPKRTLVVFGLFLALLFSSVAFAQRTTTIDHKGTKLTTGNIVTETATAPTSPAPIQGDIWIDTTDGSKKVWDGNAWEVLATDETDTELAQNTTTGVITYTAEDGLADTAVVVSTDANNALSVGGDGGAYVNSSSLGTDDQKIDTFQVNGENLELSVESDGDPIKTIPLNDIAREPWFGTDDNAAATLNTEDIYQMGNVAIGKTTAAADLDVAEDALIHGLTVGRGGGKVVSNTVLGIQALPSGTGANNVAIGNNALNAATTAQDNIAIGNNALDNGNGGQNVAIGYNTLTNTTNASSNVAVGNTAMQNLVDGDSNIAIGHMAMISNTTGNWNTALGAGAMPSVTTADYNTFIGYRSGVGITTGRNNIILGAGLPTGMYNIGVTTGSGNTIIGTGIMNLASDLQGHIIIADGAGDRRIIADTQGDVGIGHPNSPSYDFTEKLDVNGTARIRTLNPGAASDEVVVADANGVLKKRTVAEVVQEPWFGDDDDTAATTNTEDIYHMGNVGINIPDPLARLDVNGTGLFRNGTTHTTYTGDQIQFGYFGGHLYKQAIRTRHHNVSVAQNAIDFYTWDPGTDANDASPTLHGMTITGGRVGVGTRNPINNLHVHGNSTASAMRLSNSVGALIFETNNSNSTIRSNMAGELRFGNSNSGVGRNFVFSNGVWTRLFINGATGNVGIGTVSPDQLLSVDGNASKVGGGAWATFSDRRVKDNIVDYNKGLAEIMQLRPVSFNYNNLSGYDDTTTTHVGLIAQEVEQVLPSTVSNYDDSEVSGIQDKKQFDSSEVLWTMVNAVQELKEENDALKTENEDLKTRLAKIEAALGLED